jgi:hypothetical protein
VLDIGYALVVVERGAGVELELLLQEGRVVHQVSPYIPRQLVGIHRLLVQLTSLVVYRVVDQRVLRQRGIQSGHDARESI